MPLLNNPPSRGCPEPIREYIPGKITRKDIPHPKKADTNEIEKAVITISEPKWPTDAKTPVIKVEEGFFKNLKKTVKQPLVGSWRCNYHVDTIAGLSLEQAIKLIHLHNADKSKQDGWFYYETPQVLEVDIDYPISIPVRLRISNYTRKITFPKDERFSKCGGSVKEKKDFDEGYLLWTIAQEYKRIYKEWKKYGVWGHAITDLYFESIEIDKDGKCELFVGS